MNLIRLLPDNEYESVVVLPAPGSCSKQLTERHVRIEYIRFHRFPFHEERYAAGIRSYRVKLAWHLRELRALIALFFSLPLQYIHIKNLIRRYRPGIIHINSITLLAAGLAARSFGVPVIWHVRDILADNWPGKWAGKLISRCADRVLAVSNAVAERLDRSRGNILVVYNGIDPQRFNSKLSGDEARREFGIPRDAVCIGFVGRLTQQKGFLDFLEAVPAIVKIFPGAHFLAVGNFTRPGERGWLRKKFETLLTSGSTDEETLVRSRLLELNLVDRFHLTGPRTDVPNLLAAMDVVALPSYSEGFCQTVVEAMAMRKAVVSTRVAAIPELIEEDRDGILVNAGEPGQIADACIRFLQNPLFARECGLNAEKRAKEFFTIYQGPRRIETIYQEFLTKKSTTP